VTTHFDLEAYFRRIRYSGERIPTLDTLRNIHLHHTEAIPFENLNPFLGWPVQLDLQSLQQKLVRGGRGGYCYEQNLLFSHALTLIGFKVTGLAARVVWNAAEGVIPPRTHMLLRVDLDGQPYLADVGFGGLTLTAPLRLEVDLEQSTPHEPFRIKADVGEFIMQAHISGSWRSLYRFTLERQFMADYEVANWYVSTHPLSRFVNGLIAARPARKCRYALLNNEFSVHRPGEQTEKRTLTTAAELRRVLEEDFQLMLPATEEIDNALQRITRAPIADLTAS
jgi:N-hydroxyarylamine O-acetyltransferase